MASPSAASVAGCISDSHGGALADVAVEVEVTRDRWVRFGSTDARGCFRFEAALTDGSPLRFHRPGFVTITRDAITAARDYDFGQMRMSVSLEGGPEVALHRVELPGRLPDQGALAEWEPARIVSPTRYPPLAGQSAVQGVVEILCTLSPDGAVLQAEAIKGHPLLRRAATENVSAWTFHRRFPGEQVTAQVSLTYTFRLAGNPSRRPVSRFSFDYPNGATLVSEPPCPDHAPCNPEEEKEWQKRPKHKRSFP